MSNYALIMQVDEVCDRCGDDLPKGAWATFIDDGYGYYLCSECSGRTHEQPTGDKVSTMYLGLR